MAAQATHHLDQDARFGIRFALEMAGAVALLAATRYLGRLPVSDPMLSLTLKLLPIGPIWLILAVGIRHYFRIDEFQRLRFLQAMALSGGITICLFWTYAIAQPVLRWPSAPQDYSIHFSIVFIVVTLVLNLRTHRA